MLRVAAAPVDDRTRDQWLDRLWEAHQNDAIPYIERLADYWGEPCASRTRAAAWADHLIGAVESMWGPNLKPGGYFHGTIACLSALFHAGRHAELVALLDNAPHSLWHYREWGVKALATMGRKAEAIHYAEASRGLNDSPGRDCARLRLRCHESPLRRRGGPDRPALDHRRTRPRDHGGRGARRLLDHPGCGQERRTA